MEQSLLHKLIQSRISLRNAKQKAVTGKAENLYPSPAPLTLKDTVLSGP